LNAPVLIDTNKEYAFIWRFDYLDQFQLWSSKQGDYLVGTTNTISPGPSGKFTGTYFDFLNMFIVDDNTDVDEYLKNWRPISDTDLKFNVYVARFSHNGVPVTSNSSISPGTIIQNNQANVTYSEDESNYDIRFGSYEFVSFNQESSIKNNFVGGQEIFQDTFAYPGGYANSKTYHSISVAQGSANIVALTNLPNGSIFQWSNIFVANSAQRRLVIKSGNNYNVRNIVEVYSNTRIRLDEPVTFTNTTAEFLITPTGQISYFEKHSPFGINESFVIVANSTANSSVRFVNNTIESIAISSGGSGYSNDDIVYVQGFENIATLVNGGYPAVANLVTNSTGGIVSMYLSNSGCGFVNTSQISYVIANSSSGNTVGNTSSGSGADFNVGVGATLRTELTQNIFRGAKIRNIDVGEFFPIITLDNPPGVTYNFQIEMPYYQIPSATTHSGLEYYVSSNSASNRLTMTLYANNHTEDMPYTPVLPSKSNEYVIRYENGSVNDKISNADSFYSIGFNLIGNVVSNSDFTTTMFRGLPSVMFSKYVLNNDATNEHTDSGNAWAKHITKIAEFQRPAEDLRVYLTAYRPYGTDLKVYARIHKDEDPEPFDDKKWTLLEQKNTADLSSAIDTSDYVELEYGFYQYAPERTKLTGVGAATLGNSTIIGSGTLFDAELANGDVIMLRQELFPDNHIVAVVGEVVSNTELTLTENIANTSLVVEGLVIDKVSDAYENQAFNNIQKSNIVRYFNESKAKFDLYDRVAIKVVFLSDSPHRIPRIDDLRGVACSI